MASAEIEMTGSKFSVIDWADPPDDGPPALFNSEAFIRAMRSEVAA
jgi:hypothetical protein